MIQSRTVQKKATTNSTHIRSKIVLFCIFSFLFAISSRLFYWQIIAGESLTQQAENQYSKSVTLTGNRGSVYTADGYTLVSNEHVYTLFAQPNTFNDSVASITQKILPLLLTELEEYQQATQSTQKQEIAQKYESLITQRLSRNAQWVSLKTNLSEPTKKMIADLNIHGLGFDQYLRRYYPESSMAAHLTGFVGKDESGQDIGYFGVEGALEKELKARSTKNTVFTDALGLQLLGKNQHDEILVDGRSITLTIRRDIQNILETELQEAVKKYGAASGEVIVMDPKTGKILGLAAYPSYEPSNFYNFDSTHHKNPTLSNLYEPGSTLKALTVATGIEEGVITPETQCDICEGPVRYGKYTIKTWNNQYTPNITMEKGLAQSDNIAMIFIGRKIGLETWKEYLAKFKIGERINIDLQEDHDTPFPKDWGELKLATTSFGQGIVANSMQVLRAVNTIANDGIMMRPMIVESVTDTTTGEEIIHEPIEEGRIISTQTAQTVTKMMITSAQQGEAQWTASDRYIIAGKTGTSQVVTEKGYDSKKTIASFVGFAPPDDPKFIMITKLTEPTVSPWAAETAAPLWYTIANRLYLLLGVVPQ